MLESFLFSLVGRAGVTGKRGVGMGMDQDILESVMLMRNSTITRVC